MLQAYALQQVMLSMGYDCEIINFRSPAQKRQYKPIFVVGSSLWQMCTLYHTSGIRMGNIEKTAIV